MSSIKPHTARNGDPLSASRGAAVRREKEALDAAIAARIVKLGFTFDQNKRNVVIRLLTPRGKRANFATPTLGELQAMSKKLLFIRDDVVAMNLQDKRVLGRKKKPTP